MKKIFWIYALILNLICTSAVRAENTKSIPLKKHPDLKEIVLNKEEIFEASYTGLHLKSDLNQESRLGLPTQQQEAANILNATSYRNKFIATNISPTESSLEYKNKPQEKEKGFFSIFNLRGGVEKIEPQPEVEGKVEETALQHWLNGDSAAGKWFGARPILEDKGLSIDSSLLYSPFMKTGGGANGEISGKGYTLFNLSVTLDTEKSGLWKGGTFYALYQNKRGYGIAGPTGAMGDWMVLDNWDWRQLNQMSEYWYQQKLFDNKLRLKFGKQDANIDFGFLNSGWDFMNTAFSINPTVPMPTYPDQAFGFMAEVNPKEWLSIRNGIYSRYNTPFNMTEIEIKPTIKKLPGRYMLGAWELSDSSGFDVASGINSDGSVYYNNFNRNFGVYVGFEQMIYKEKKNDDNDMQGLVVFSQFGMSPSNRNDMCRYASGGLHYIGPIPKRDKDIIGLAAASGTFAPRLGDVTSQVGDETALEAFYRVQITPWFYLQPDVQFIMRPSGTYDSSVAIGLRSVIAF